MRSFYLTKGSNNHTRSRNYEESGSSLHLDYSHVLYIEKITIYDPPTFMVLAVHSIHKNTLGMIGVKMLFAFSPSPGLLPLAHDTIMSRPH